MHLAPFTTHRRGAPPSSVRVRIRRRRLRRRGTHRALELSLELLRSPLRARVVGAHDNLALVETGRGWVGSSSIQLGGSLRLGLRDGGLALRLGHGLGRGGRPRLFGAKGGRSGGRRGGGFDLLLPSLGAAPPAAGLDALPAVSEDEDSADGERGEGLGTEVDADARGHQRDDVVPVSGVAETRARDDRRPPLVSWHSWRSMRVDGGGAREARARGVSGARTRADARVSRRSAAAGDDAGHGLGRGRLRASEQERRPLPDCFW